MRITVAVALVLAGCGDDGGGATPDASGAIDATIDASVGYRAEVVRELTFSRDGRNFPVQLVRVHRPDGARTYVHWIKSDKSAPYPTVLSTDPYGGIDWTGEEVDTRWATRGAGVYDDVDQPDYDGSAQVTYQPAPIEMVHDQEFIHLLNGFAVLRVHGRFYAGGSVGDDIEDMKAGMWFLAEQPEVDRSKVGTFGGSWGGFESVYASAFGDRRVAPLVTVALYPPVDFSEWLPYGHSRAEPTLAALEGHRRRIEATTGPVASASYAGLRYADLCAGLPAATLVLHDELDNLVPIRQSEQLVATCGGDAIYWRRAAEPDPSAGTHGPLLDETNYPSAYTYAIAYLHRRLAPGAQLIGAVARPALVAHLTTVHDAQVRGEDVAFAAPRLRELVDPMMYFLELPSAQLPSGAEVVATAVNAVWGTSYTAATIDGALAAGLPSP
ncbi:MAG: prolyl oligopeptidase family serine peptidase [Kofleriaceae bacterium]|nr:prolyl oligopeptidase family serine peptidase [Kofleriaceae bacterium]